METAELDELLKELSRKYALVLRRSFGEKLLAVVLYGSVARNEATQYSDIDLLVIASDLPEGRFARQKHLEAADKELDPELQKLRRQGVFTDFCPMLKTPEEAGRIIPLYLDLVEDAVILYERAGFFSAILERLRRSLERLGARRVRTGRVRYWELKPDYMPGEIFEL